jgi:SAM-dependent methyltransferase
MLINDTAIDWGKEWIVRSDARNESDDSSVWDARSEDYAMRKDMSDYASAFLAGLDLAPGDTVFDMGSGTGALAIPLAEMGYRVVCGDFSPGMRTALRKRAVEAGVSDAISTFAMSWEDDWQAAGVAPKSVDIAVASRSVMVHDLRSALEKLESIARKQVAITVPTRFGPRAEREVGEMLYGLPYLPDSIYAVNILFDRGRNPNVSYIGSYKDTEDGGKRLIRWAFIRWNVE